MIARYYRTTSYHSLSGTMLPDRDGYVKVYAADEPEALARLSKEYGELVTFTRLPGGETVERWTDVYSQGFEREADAAKGWGPLVAILYPQRARR